MPRRIASVVPPHKRRIPLIRLLLALLLLPACAPDSKQTTIHQWEVYTESVSNPSYEVDPFDLIAHVTFTHRASGEERTTQMYYDGADVWAFRFNGSRTGEWTYRSTSSDPDLDGLRGRIIVRSNPNPSARGFVRAAGSKWARQVGEDSLEAFVPQIIMYDEVDEFYDNPSKIARDADTFLSQLGFTGFVTQVGTRWFDIHAANASQVSDTNPDLRTFEALELLIQTVRAHGGIVHIWMWGDAGDSSGDQTQVRWGINGQIDRTLQRYIAARLGPIPGWTLSYGYDLDEWVTEAEVDSWYNYLEDHWGWPHLATARSHGPNQGTNHVGYVFAESLPVMSYEHHRPDYETYVAALNHRPGKPVFSEDRFRVRQSDHYNYKDYTEKMTRRGLWASTMAGGVANIWGRQEDRENTELGYPYRHTHWMRTYFDFFEGRFDLDMVRENGITDGYGLRRGRSEYIVYKEDADAIEVNLSGAGRVRTAVAVDAAAPYSEIDISEDLKEGVNIWGAPSRSDWALYIETDGPAGSGEETAAAEGAEHDGEQSVRPTNLASDLVYYLMMDDSHTARMQDAHGTNDFAKYGSFNFVPGIQGYAPKLNSRGDYLLLENNANIAIEGSTVTWVFWAKPDVTGNSMRVISKLIPRAEAVHYDYVIYISSTDSAVPLAWRPWFGDGSDEYFIAKGPHVIDGEWQMVAVTVDPVANEVRTSVNAGLPVVDQLPFDPVNHSNAPLRIGDSEVADPYRGLLDEILFAKRALSHEEIEWLHNGGVGRNYYEVVGQR